MMIFGGRLAARHVRILPIDGKKYLPAVGFWAGPACGGVFFYIFLL
jgi:hypothetical protein